MFLVSLDFELFWGMTDHLAYDDYKENILGARVAIPRLLNLFEKYGIHATWATVGLLFAESKAEAEAFSPELRPTYDNPVRSTYCCFDRLSDSEEGSPEFFAPSLIKLVSETKGQEIGTHTFSHYYCLEKGQTPKQFEEDMKAAKTIAGQKGYDVTSVVLPRNQCSSEYIEVLDKLGFTAYRDEENDWIHEKIGFKPLKRLLRLADVYLPLTGMGGYVPKKEGNILNLVGSRMYKPYFRPLAFLEKLKVLRIKKQMKNAAKKGLAFHLWWHPHNIGVRTDLHLKQLEEIFSYFEKLKEEYGMQSLNMREAADYFAGE